tara:strand:- start:140 stop:427 length:288 start_codon:yes stop_codon:yes gene_type:complete
MLNSTVNLVSELANGLKRRTRLICTMNIRVRHFDVEEAVHTHWLIGIFSVIFHIHVSHFIWWLVGGWLFGYAYREKISDLAHLWAGCFQFFPFWK